MPPTIALWLPTLIGAVDLGTERREGKLPCGSLPIGMMAEHTGVKVETIRYCERINLLPKPSRGWCPKVIQPRYRTQPRYFVFCTSRRTMS